MFAKKAWTFLFITSFISPCEIDFKGFIHKIEIKNIMLPLDIFKTVIESTPLVSIDLIVRNKQGQILLGKRTNRPAQGYWFVPGGRVLKDESFERAFKRLMKAELGVTEVESNFKGIYQHFYEDNFSEDKFTTHYIVLAYEIRFNGQLSLLPVEQHSDYQWFDESELLLNEGVHTHTKWYFQKDKQAALLFNSDKNEK